VRQGTIGRPTSTSIRRPARTGLAAASATSKAGPLFDLGVWLQANAATAGFVQPYTPGRTGGYSEEPWHYSYAPIAIGLRQRYNAQVNLWTDVADAFLADMKARAKKDGVAVPADLDAAVKSLKVSDFVNTIAPGL
jgi:D-alanyl-D-alanine carboxypeptidase